VAAADDPALLEGLFGFISPPDPPHVNQASLSETYVPVDR
jgi:hypothetical protein